MKKIELFFVLMMVFFNVSAQNIKKNNNESYAPDGRVWEIRPGQDYSAILDSLKPGDQLAFHEGEYDGRVVVKVSGLPGKPIVIRGYGNGEKRPVLTYKENKGNLLQVNGDYLIFDYLEFRSLRTYAIRIGLRDDGRQDVTIKNCLFYECGGGSISANAPATAYKNIHIIDNYFIGPKTTPVYIGDHSGAGAIEHFVFRGNVIDGSQNDGREGTTGYGIQLKLNVIKSIIENNFITGTKGPGIMVYGATDPDPANANIVKNNIVVGSRRDGGIVVGGGPSEVRNNLLIGCNAGVAIENYAGRGLLNNIIITGNTAVLSKRYNIALGSAPSATVQRNVSIALAGAKDFTGDPRDSDKNQVVPSSPSFEETVAGVMNIIPEKKNLDKIWRRLAKDAPLTKKKTTKLINLLTQHAIPVKVSH
ncbi:MAG TPA: right-handed parallel beta-helix repeat-containing protein [Flavitalea sp.]|nr:right-handed parallel beta-helix repeat-containing protein [Flavitalea sp.]